MLLHSHVVLAWELRAHHAMTNRLRSSVTGGGVGGLGGVDGSESAFEARPSRLWLSVLEAVPRGLGLSASESPGERLSSGSASVHTAPQRHIHGDAVLGQVASTEASLHLQRSLLWFHWALP